MTIVQELTTKLGFSIDTAALNRFTNMTTGAQGKMFLFASSIQSALGLARELVGVLDSTASFVIGTSDIGKQIGLATKDLVALREAASQFRIPSSSIDSVLLSLNQSLNQARFGYGEIFDIQNQLGISLKDSNGQYLKAEKALLRILEATRKIENIQERGRILGNIPGIGQEMAQRFVEFGNDGEDTIKKLTDGFQDLGKSVQNTEENFKNFQSSMASFGSDVKQIGFDLVEYWLPPIATILSALSWASKWLNIMRKDLKEIDEQDYLDLPLTQQEAASKKKFNDIWGGFMSPNAKNYTPPNHNNITNNNVFNVSVPAGFTEGQAIRVINESFNESMEYVWREVINNSTQIEGY